ncbi:MAG: hypothetical protein JWO78_2247 [Micavibrio sp.]|nr:hypothetical protein [Micavibrio sp.]
MQKQTTTKQANALKNIDFKAWQFSHAKKEYRFIAIDRLIRSNQHQEAPVHVN